MISAVNEFLDDMRGGRMSEAPVVKVEQGQLQGKVVSGPSGKPFYSFQGIPYAKPPLGSLRFKAPQPSEPWDGVRDATSEGNVSAQIDPFQQQYIGDENCLFLNVYTPTLDGEFLPVMVYIHGGGFRFGSGSSSLYGGDYLVERDVVVVTINYRCGALGFLSLNTPEVPGNAGLKDMVQALRWIKQNIQNFGGNSGNLTLFGESCGGVAASILSASPLTKDMISKAIIQSGTALNSWAFQRNPLENARTLARYLGCEAEDIDEILDFLRATPVKDIIEATEKFRPHELFIEKGGNIFSAVVEKEFLGVEAVLTEAFIDIITSGRIAEIPVMIGSTTLEFTCDRINDDLQIFIPEDFHIDRNSEESVKIAEQMKELYFKGKHPGVETLNEYFELLSDKLVNVDTHRYIQYLVNVTNKPIYYYKFDYVGELNNTKHYLNSFGLKHAGHTDELGYLFKSDNQKDVEPTPQDVKMRERMLRLWTNFAKSGNPTPDENHYITVTWLPVNKDNLYYLNLSNELSLETNPSKEKMDFWDNLYSKYSKIWEHPKISTETPRKETTVIVEETRKSDGHFEVTTITETTTTNEVISETKFEPEHIIEEVKSHQPDPKPVVENKEEPVADVKEIKDEPEKVKHNSVLDVNDAQFADAKDEQIVNIPTNGIKPYNGVHNGNSDDMKKNVRTSNEIKMVQNSNGVPKDVIRANDPPEDDLPKNIGVNKFVNFFESLGGKK